MQLLAIVVKELRLLSRDIHGLALLFVMPVVFILIMSMAMKADFDRRSGVQLEVVVRDLANTEASQAILATLKKNSLFALLPAAELPENELQDDTKAGLEQAVQNDRYHFLLTINDREFGDVDVDQASVLIAPANSPELNQLFFAALQQAMVRQSLTESLATLEASQPDMSSAALLDELDGPRPFSIRYAGSASPNQAAQAYDETPEAPTSVQQNVPAWLVFAAFFIVVPMANTLINERNFGTLKRMRSIAIAPWKLLVGKMLPYYFINQLQVLVLLLVGFFLVPLLGGDQLTLGQSPLALLLISSALSMAALGYGILIAVICRTTEQATTLGGAGNIILAALGGIMVPAFVMPAFMQELTVISPMSWGLQGFLDVFLRGGGVAAVLPEALSLLLLGLVMMIAATLLFYRHKE